MSNEPTQPAVVSDPPYYRDNKQQALAQIRAYERDQDPTHLQLSQIYATLHAADKTQELVHTVYAAAANRGW